MRILCLLLLVCLVAAGPVAAIAVNPVSMPAVARVSLTPQPAATMPPLRTIWPTTTAVPVQVPLTINSVPAGATVLLNGWSSYEITPVTVYLSPGPHTVGLSLDGYKDYTMTVTLLEGHAGVINAQLVRNVTVNREDVVALKTFGTPQTITRFITPVTRATDGADTTMCLSGQKCLALHEAAAQYPDGYSYQVDGPVCGHVTLSNGTSVPRYCVSVPAGSGIQAGKIPAGALAPVGGKVKIVTASPDMSMQVQPSVMAPRELGATRQAGVFDSFLGFFNGLFTRQPVCPQGKTACDGGCADLMTDSSHCGRCDYFCFEPGVCQAGECVEAHGDLGDRMSGVQIL